MAIEDFDYHRLVGQEVEVTADGMVYRGRLVEMGEEDLHLESPGGWTTIRVDRVSSVRLSGS